LQHFVCILPQPWVIIGPASRGARYATTIPKEHQMNDAERLQLTKLFVAAVYTELSRRNDSTSPSSVPLDPSAFAEAVRRQATGNRIASRFPIYTTVSGPLCPDFQHGMAVAQSAGLISRMNPSFQRFAVNLSARQVQTFATDDRFLEVQKLAREYLALTLGEGTSNGERAALA
jgi:hypothetical protein